MKTALLVAVTVCVATPVAAEPQRLAELTFERGSTRIDRDAVPWDRILSWALDHPEGVIVVGGHAHREGNPRETGRLALWRAQAVREALVEIGVDPYQIIVATYGDAGAKRRVVIWGSDPR